VATQPEPPLQKIEDDDLESRYVRAVLDLLVNRADAYGAYHGSGEAYTAKQTLTADVLRQHFRGHRSVGLHLISKANTCRFCAFDVDAHHGENPVENEKIARSIVEQLSALGYEPILLDSDGRGGFHVLVIFEAPAPSRDVHALGHDVAPDGVEFFPKQDEVNDSTPLGSWLRLPGRHPARDHWTRAIVNGKSLNWEDTAEFLTDPPTSPLPPRASGTSPVAGDKPTSTPTARTPGNRRSAAKVAEAAEIPKGYRNDALASLAGSFRRPGMTEKEIGVALLAVNAGRCRPPLPDGDVLRIAASVAGYAADDVMEIVALAPASPEKGLAAVNAKLLGHTRSVRIRRFVRLGGPRGLVVAELADGGRVPLGSISKLVALPTFRKALAEVTKILVPALKPKDWDGLCQVILHLIEEEDGESVERQIDELLRAALEANRPADADDEEELREFGASRRHPYLRRAGKLYLRLESLMRFNRTSGSLKLDQSELGHWLQLMGWTYCRPGFGSRGDQIRPYVYEAPEGWWQCP